MLCGRKSSFTDTLVSEEISLDLRAAEKVLDVDEKSGRPDQVSRDDEEDQ